MGVKIAIFIEWMWNNPVAKGVISMFDYSHMDGVLARVLQNNNFNIGD